MTKKIDGLWFQSEEARNPPLLASDDDLRDLAEKYSAEDMRKMFLLCEHYGIKDGPHMFYSLALVLAREIYPEPKKRGRKSKWTALNKGALVVEVERHIRPNDPTHGVEWACNLLSKREPWASFIQAKESGTLGPDPAESLRKIYFDFRNDKWANVFRDGFKKYEHDGAIERWEDYVIDLVRNSHPK